MGDSFFPPPGCRGPSTSVHSPGVLASPPCTVRPLRGVHRSKEGGLGTARVALHRCWPRGSSPKKSPARAGSVRLQSLSRAEQAATRTSPGSGPQGRQRPPGSPRLDWRGPLTEPDPPPRRLLPSSCTISRTFGSPIFVSSLMTLFDRCHWKRDLPWRLHLTTGRRTCAGIKRSSL